MKSLPARSAARNRTSGKLALAIALIGCVALTSPAAGDQPGVVNGLTEPYREIDVAAAESGVVAELFVEEAQTVRRGQILATLDCDVHVALLAIARQGMEAKGRLNSARAEVQLQESRLDNFEAVLADGYARLEEVERVRTNLAIAKAQLQAVDEELLLRKLEYEKIEAQIERRTLRSPIDGVVSHVYKEEAEFLAPNDPTLLTLVQLDPLLAIFSLDSDLAKQLHTGQDVAIRFSGIAEAVPGNVDLIAPTTDPESGTVLVKIRIANPAGLYRSGERCSMEVSGGPLTPSERPLEANPEPDPTIGSLSRRHTDGLIRHPPLATRATR